MEELNAPIDPLHKQCLRMAKGVNKVFQQAKDRAAKWEPRPCPTT